MRADLPRPFRVVARRRETERCVTLTLEPADGMPYHFRAGQFNMLGAFGHGDVPISLSGKPGRPRIMHTIAAVGQATQTLCQLRPGAEVGLRGPFGHGWPVTQATGGDLLVVAGGVGLAPLRPVLYQRHRFRELALVAGARRPGDLLYQRQLAGWNDPWLTVDAAGPGWSGRVGTILPWLAPALGRLERDRCLAFVCGPEIMVRLAAQELVKLGLSEERIHVSLERNMKCAFGICGHCQLGPELICRDGPVFPYARVRRWLEVREL